MRNHEVSGNHDFRDERLGRRIQEECQIRPTGRRRRIRAIDDDEWKRNSQSRDGHSRRRNDIDKGISRQSNSHLRRVDRD